MNVLGIDEAGRGCVLGELVIGAFFTQNVSPALLAGAGAADSKRLSPKRRMAVAKALAKLGTADVRLISCPKIDAGNLNTLEEQAITELVLAHRPDRVIVDALGHPATLPALKQRLAMAWATHGLTPQLVVEPKADANHPVVGAASIIAKTTRDARLATTTANHGNVGSGYPSDPKTRAWLAQWFATGKPWPAFVRTRWGTVRDLVASAGSRSVS